MGLINVMKVQCLVAASMIMLSSCSEDTWITSPDGKIRIDFEMSPEGQPTYAVRVGAQSVIGQSCLGIEAKGWPSFSGKPDVSISHSSHDEEWTSPWGESKKHRNNYNEMAVRLSVPSEPGSITIRFRAFDDGVAFRYETDATGVDSLTVTDELTEFNIAGNGTSWSIPGNFETYELDYRTMPIGDVVDANTPFTFMLEDGLIYGSIHEAALYDYPEMVLRRNETGLLKADLAPLPDGVKAYVPACFTTPWRTIQLASNAVGLINSSMILNLNEPSRISDCSWIEPQKYVGIWWGMHLGTQTWTMGPRHGATTANAIRYIDFAAENNIQGVLFEGWNQGWDNWGGNQHFDYMTAYADFDVDSVSSYAHAKGIELWMHNETGGNIPEYESQLDSIFAYYQSLGVHTVKTGYAGGFKGGYLHHSQYGVKHYQRVVETAAQYQIMIDAHEPIKDTGIRRTWPNMMTREGARGMEWNAWSAGNTADYLCILPFARLLGGPMDYTPGIFDVNYERAKADKGRLEWNGPNADCCIKTTLARQIANWVIIYSPLQMAADQIENYERNPAFQFFRDFNADCDQSQALQGEIGKYIMVMRRAGDRYYLGAGTNSESLTVSQPLDFLQPGVTYHATIYADKQGASDRSEIEIGHRDVTNADTLTIRMNASGGQAVTFLPL